MRLTQHTDFSLRILIHLALQPERLTTIQEISTAYGISRNHLMKVAQKLARTGYVDSVRGQGGGLRLQVAPEDMRLGDIVEAMEPDFGLVECLRPGNECVITPACALPLILQESLRLFVDNLNRYTLADLLPPKAKPRLAELLQLEAL